MSPSSEPTLRLFVIAAHISCNDTNISNSTLSTADKTNTQTSPASSSKPLFNMSIPTDFSAVENNDFSYLYYARSNGLIAVLKSSTTQEGNDTMYNPTNVMLAGNTVSTAAPRISAVSYKDSQGNRQVRIYYIGPGRTGAGFQLRELCQTNDGEWKTGELDKNSVTCGKDSLLSANVEYGKGDLKIFFQDADNNPWVAWVVLGQTAWAARPLDPIPFKW